MEKKIKITYIVSYLVILIFFIVFFNVIGLRMILGLSLIVLPFFMILRYFNLPFEENIIYSLFLALVFYPVLVYYVGIMDGSIRLAMLIVFIVLFIYGLIINIKRADKHE